MPKTQMQRRRRPMRRETKRTLLWLVCCFPFGLVLMWRRRCRWPVAAKCAVSACVALALLAVILPQTAPTRSTGSGVEYVLSEPEVNVHGPELPSALQENPVDYESVLRGGATSVPMTTPAAETYVYAATNGKSYHTTACRYYSGASHRYTIYEAHFSGYTPCDLCNPGVYGQ